jgi:hypothetical protein
LRYLCLIYNDERQLSAMSAYDFEGLVDEMVAYDEELRGSGQVIFSDALEPVRTAATVRLREGQVSVTDGPFAETKEQLGGYFLIEARDLNEAIQLAGRIPAARLGSIEVRPITEGRCRQP